MSAALGIVAGWMVLSGAFMLVAKAAEMRAAGTLSAFWLPTVYTWFAFGLALDIAFNVVVGWIIFGESPLLAAWGLLATLAYLVIGRFIGMEPPDAELTFSSHVNRHYRESNDWRWDVAAWWARQLNAVAPGHIG